MPYSLVHFHHVQWIVALVIVQFHYATCALHLGPVHFHYTNSTMGTFTMGSAPCTVVGALQPSTLDFAPYYDAILVYTLQIRMMWFHNSPCTMHYGMMHFHHVPCGVHRVTMHSHHAPRYRKFPLCIVNRGLAQFHHPLWTLNLKPV